MTRLPFAGLCAVALASLALSAAAADQPAQQPLWIELPAENHQVAPGRYRIPLNMEEAAGVDRRGEPVRCGVPVPRGVLRDAAAVRLTDSSGAERLVQVEPGGFWPDGSYKWILLDFAADLKAGAKDVWQLEFGKGVAPSVKAPQLRVSEDDDFITVDTGVLKFTLLKRKNVFIHEAWVDADRDGKYGDPERVVAPLAKAEQRGLFVDLFHKTRGAGLYWAALQPKPDEVKIEAAGPYCAEICVKGWHHAAFGRDNWTHVSPRAFQYILRIRAYAGSADLKVFHTFVNTEEPLDMRVRSIGIRLPLDAGETPSYAFGSSDAFRKQGGADQDYYLVQDHWDNFQLEKGGPMPELKPEQGGDPVALMGAWQGGTILEKGAGCEGWADLSGPRAGLTVVFRDMVKLFPKELQLTGNDVVACIWPKHKRPTRYEFFGGGEKSYIDLRQPNEVMSPELQRLKEKHPAIYTQWLIGQDSDWDRYKSWPYRGNALGVAKTHELTYRFHAGAVDPAQAKALAAAASEPIQPFVTPQWYCWETEAFGRMQPQDAANFPRMEAEMSAFMDWLYRHQNEWSHFWGLFDFGDFQTYHASSKYGAYPYNEEFGPWGKWLGRYGWLNGEYNNDFDAFLQYFRTGRLKDFRVASAYAAHHADVDTCHYNPEHPDWVGAQHRHSVAHWSDWLIDQQTYADGMIALYYATGDRRMKDAALAVAGYSMYAGIPFRYWQEETKGREATVEYRDHRGTWCKITNIARAYEMTADREMRRHLDAWIKVVAANQNPWGGPRGSFEPYMGACFPLVYAVTDSEEMKKVIAGTGFASSVSTLGSFSPYSALQWRLTRDDGPFLAPQVWGANGWQRRHGAIPDNVKEVKPDSFSTCRTTPVLAWPHIMGAIYDARYDDRTPPQAASPRPPDAPKDAHFVPVDLRPFMNEDPFGDMRNGKALPWPKPDAFERFLDDTLGKAGGKVVFCGSGQPGFKADQDIANKIKAGEIGLTNWSLYPSNMFEPPMTRSFAPEAPCLLWGPVPFDIVDPATNDGKGMIALKAGEQAAIPVGLKARKLYFLGHVYALRYPRDPVNTAIVPLMARVEVGRYVLHFADGETKEIPIVNRQNASACIYGYASTEAPFVLGSAGGSGWPPSGGVCAFEVDCGNKEIKSLDFRGADPNKAILLWAVTALVDGAVEQKPAKIVQFGGGRKSAGNIEVVVDQKADGKTTGWLTPSVVEDKKSAIEVKPDQKPHILRVALPEDGWYQVDLMVAGRGAGQVISAISGDRLVLNSVNCAAPRRLRFAAEARDGVMDLRFLPRPFSVGDGPQTAGCMVLYSAEFIKLAQPPAHPPRKTPDGQLLRFGWDNTVPTNAQTGGALLDNTLRFDVPPGQYKVTLKTTPSAISSHGQKLDIYVQDKLAVDDHPVTAQTAFNVDAASGFITIRIALDKKASTGRIQQWAVDRVVLERAK